MKIDFHVHTYYSADGAHSPRRMVKQAKKEGLDGIAITDHHSTGGWEEALAAGKDAGIIVVLGEEIKIREQGKITGEVLGLFLNEIIVDVLEFDEVLDIIHDQGAIAIPAHPFDLTRNNFEMLENYVTKLDAIETLSARCWTEEPNKAAALFAKKYKLPKVGGSDAHTWQEIGKAWTDIDVSSESEIIKAIKSGKCKPVKGHIGFGRAIRAEFLRGLHAIR